MSAQIMRKIVLLPCALSVLIVSACLPAPTTYFKPSAPGAEYTKSSCSESVGPEDRVVLSGPEGIMIGVQRFERRGLRAYFRTYYPGGPEIDDSGTGVSIAINVPATLEYSVQFGSAIFQLTDELTKTVYEYRAEYIMDFPDADIILDGFVVAIKSLKPELTMRRMDIRQPLPVISPRIKYRWPTWFGRKPEHLYYILLTFPQINADQFALRLPPVLVGSTTYQFPVIQFRRVTEWFLYPMNC